MKEQNCPPPGVLATSHEVLHDEHAMPFDELYFTKRSVTHSCYSS